MSVKEGLCCGKRHLFDNLMEEICFIVSLHSRNSENVIITYFVVFCGIFHNNSIECPMYGQTNCVSGLQMSAVDSKKMCIQLVPLQTL